MNQSSPDKALIARPSSQLLQLLKSGQLLVLVDQPCTALILQKAFHAEFVGPGAAVGGVFDLNTTAIYPLGNVNFLSPETGLERKQAFQQRMDYIEALQSITIEQTPFSRSNRIFTYLHEWVGQEVTQHIPDELIASLVGVFPQTIAIARQQWREALLSSESLFTSRQAQPQL